MHEYLIKQKALINGSQSSVAYDWYLVLNGKMDRRKYVRPSSDTSWSLEAFLSLSL
jgi:hypothetical protein